MPYFSSILLAAAFYNIIWGASVVLFPSFFFSLFGMAQPNYPWLWQCIGMIVGVYGVGYAIAATNPRQHWPIVLVGFLGKVCGPLGFAISFAQGLVPLSFGTLIIFNDLIWLPFFGLFLWRRYRSYLEEENEHTRSLDEALRIATVEGAVPLHGLSLWEASHASPVLLVALRHSGCTFCRETIDTLTRHQDSIRKKGITPVILHMGKSTDDIQPLLSHYGFTGGIVTDPTRSLYRALALRRGSLLQVLGPTVWIRGIAGILKGYGVGSLQGDGFQLPGSFLIRHGTLVWTQRAQSASERIKIDEALCAI